VLWSRCYVVLRRVLQIAALRPRSQEFQELQIVVLRHQLCAPASGWSPRAEAADLWDAQTRCCAQAGSFPGSGLGHTPHRVSVHGNA
jgi:hypothetical protein